MAERARLLLLWYQKFKEKPEKPSRYDAQSGENEQPAK
jgi:hypothetical protein